MSIQLIMQQSIKYMNITNFLLCFLASFTLTSSSFQYSCSLSSSIVSCTSDESGRSCAALGNCCTKMVSTSDTYTLIVLACSYCSSAVSTTTFQKYIRSTYTNQVCDCGQIDSMPSYRITAFNILVPAIRQVMCNNHCCGKRNSQINSAGPISSTGVLIGATIGGIVGIGLVTVGIVWIIMKRNALQVIQPSQVVDLQVGNISEMIIKA